MKTFLSANWNDIVMINYEAPKDCLIPYIPYGTELDDFEGKFYVSLVGFKFLKSKIFNVAIPFLGSFDEVNLRFYVKRKVNNEIRRGVVFISEIVPFKTVAILANVLYKEHYLACKMESDINIKNDSKHLKYGWQFLNENYFIKATFSNKCQELYPNTHSYFIYEHYYGYTKVNDKTTWEYKVNHATWKINEVIDFDVKCDFDKVYGNNFSFLNEQKPHSIYNAIGSRVTIDWKVDKIKK